jgi:hypothetical protein
MTTSPSTLRQLTVAVLSTVICIANALAESPNALALVQAQERYRQDMAECNGAQSSQSVVACRAASARAFAEAKHGANYIEPTQYQRNALQRCAVHQGDDRAACEVRIMDQSDVSADVEAGGLLRKSITVIPAQ